MPTISRFFGIDIQMFYKEHPPPHFHAEYQGKRGTFDFEGNMIKGNIRSKTALRLIKQWAILHRDELAQNWDNIEREIPLAKIAPLD